MSEGTKIGVLAPTTCHVQVNFDLSSRLGKTWVHAVIPREWKGVGAPILTSENNYCNYYEYLFILFYFWVLCETGSWKSCWARIVYRRSQTQGQHWLPCKKCLLYPHLSLLFLVTKICCSILLYKKLQRPHDSNHARELLKKNQKLYTTITIIKKIKIPKHLSVT